MALTFVVVNDRVQSVCNCKDGAVLKCNADHLLNLLVRLDVDRSSTLIHNEQLQFASFNFGGGDSA
jgi:hypothetical protein